MRRVVIGLNGSGKSTAVSDGLPRVLFHFRDQAGPHEARAERVSAPPVTLEPGEGVLAELWSTESTPPSFDGDDPTEHTQAWSVECSPGATRFRTSRFSPGRTTAMHTTNTLDHDFVLEGSVTLMLSDGSAVELAADDAVVIPGLAHAGRAGPDGCRLGLVMLGMA